MKEFKQYLKEMFGHHDISTKLSDLAHKLDSMGTKDDKELANKIFEFLSMHEATGFPKAELKSLKDDIFYFAKKWHHVVNKMARDDFGQMVLDLRNNVSSPVEEDLDGPADLTPSDVEYAEHGPIEPELIDEGLGAADAPYCVNWFEGSHLKKERFDDLDDAKAFGKEKKGTLYNLINGKLIEDFDSKDDELDESQDDYFYDKETKTFKSSKNKKPVKEESEYDYGTDDYYDIETKTFKPIEFVDKGKADLKNKMNNPRYGDNSLKDVTLQEDSKEKKMFNDDYEGWKKAVKQYHPDAYIVKYPDPPNYSDGDGWLWRAMEGDNWVGEYDKPTFSGWVYMPSNLDENLDLKTNMKLDELQEILNDAGISDDEIIAGLKGFKPQAKVKVANKLGVSKSDLDFMMNELSTKLSHADEKNYSLFTEDYHNTMNSDDRYGYEEDTLGNVTINDTETGKSASIQGTEAQDLLNKLFSNPTKKQEILAKYENLMEAKKEKNWKATGKNNINQAVSKNIKEEKTKEEIVSDKKAPFAFTKKLKKKVNEAESEDDSFHDEIHGNDSGTYNFPWKDSGLHGTGTASFSLKNNTPLIKIISVRNPEGDEITAYNHDNVLAQAKKFIPDA
jgi:hypothetical protein